MSDSHGHSHSHGPGPQAGRENRARLLITIGIVAVVLVVEVIGGILSGSLALFADAGHMLSDLTGLLVALVALTMAARPATDARTFGHRRAEVFGALTNGLILLVVVGFVVVEAVTRIIEPAVAAPLMLLVSVLGVIANTVGLLVLRGGTKDSINMRGTYLEVLGDLVGPVAVIVAAIVILSTGFERADAITSLAIAGLIVHAGSRPAARGGPGPQPGHAAWHGGCADPRTRAVEAGGGVGARRACLVAYPVRTWFRLTSWWIGWSSERTARTSCSMP